MVNIMVNLAMCGIVGSCVYPWLSIKWGYLVFMSQSRQCRQAATIHLILLPTSGQWRSNVYTYYILLEVQENEIKAMFRIPNYISFQTFESMR